jgi:hypothetical protein
MSIETKDLVAFVKKRPSLCVCATLAVVFGLTLYFRAGITSELQATLETKEKEHLRLSNNMKFSAQLEQQLEALREANRVIESGALRVADLARNQQLFLEIEAETGVKLVDVRQLSLPSPPAAGKGPAKGPGAAATYIGIPFSLTVRGEFSPLLTFMKKLEAAPTLSRVNSAAFGPPNEEGQSISFNVELLGFRP